ncbi:MAG: transcriptional repressor [Butyrivibrio sp.]|nr:transcriptional repressor [Butyrivibrio sp.]
MNNDQIVEALKESGMRVTRQRKLVADVIAENDGASCKDICCIVRGKDSSVGVATVYRMIKALEDIGVIERIDMIKLAASKE